MEPKQAKMKINKAKQDKSEQKQNKAKQSETNRVKKTIKVGEQWLELY
jgi:hypothetical protein